MRDPDQPVRTRRVFHIPGYDPFPARRYRELYRSESALQAGISGYEIALQPATPGDSAFHWHVRADMDAQTTATRIDVLVWSDIVRASMAQSLGATYAQMLRTAWIYLGTGTLARLTLLRKGPVIAALYPVAMLLAQAAAALAAGWGVAAFLPGVPLAVRVVIAAAVGYGVLRWFRARDNRLFAHYLIHDYAFGAQHRGATPPALDARLDSFAATIARALQDPANPVDEVLIVGHSSGAHLAVQVAARLLRGGQVPADGPHLAILSLGQVVPMVAFLPDADALRADLALLSTAPAITWVDVTAPGDGCCFALCDPVAVTGVAPPQQRWPLVVSAAFTQSLSPARWQALRWRFFRLHFQYLCAFDRPRDYDYFAITAGPRALAARYAGRRHSASRIARPTSRYTGTR